MYEWERNIPSLSFIEKQISVSNNFYFFGNPDMRRSDRCLATGEILRFPVWQC